MNVFFSFIHQHRSCCLHCGAFSVSHGLLCELCAQCLTSLEQRETVLIPPMRLRSLYSWYPGQSDMLSKLILKLKGGGLNLAWTHYAEKFMKKNIMEISNVKKVCIIPAPASSEGQKDHAFLWGQALADSFGADFVPLLKKVSNRHQRGGDRGERALVEMEIVENYSKDMSFTHETLFVFADDVLTTGATARAAFKALGSPPYFEIWALAHRRLSCGASTDLLYKQNV